jgi:hypothetical protein
MNKAHRAIATLGTTLALATAAAAAAMPAEAQASSWGVVFSTHYGVAVDYSGYTTVIALGSDDAWAFGANDLSGGDGTSPQQPVAVQWNGTAWQASAMPTSVPFGITAASAISASDIWAVTQFGGYVLHWDGSTWSVATQLPGSSQDSGQVTDITAFSDSNVWVYGGAGFTSGLGTWHYDGNTWTQQTDSSAGIDFASAVSPTDIWAVGTDGTAPENALVNYNGTAWQPVTSSALTGLSFGHILAISATNVWVAAASPAGTANTFLMHFDGSSWSQVTLPLTINISELASDGQGGIWVTGQDSSGNTWVADMSASGTWSSTQIASSGTTVLSLANVPGTTAMWAAGWVETTPNGSNATIWANGAPPASAQTAAVGVEGTNGALWVQAPQLASGWQSLGGVISAAPAVVGVPGSGGSTPLFFATGSTGQLWMTTVTSGWQPVGPNPAYCIGSPAAVVTGSTLTVACEGTNQQLFYNTATVPATGLPAFTSAWTSLGGTLTAGPAVAPVGGTVTFFARGTTGQVFTATATTGYTAQPWTCIGHLAAATDTTTSITTFACQGTDHALWEATNPGTGWSAATSLGGVLIDGPGIAAGAGTTEFFAEGSNHAVWERTAASGWTSLGGVVIGGAGAVALN